LPFTIATWLAAAEIGCGKDHVCTGMILPGMDAQVIVPAKEDLEASTLPRIAREVSVGAAVSLASSGGRAWPAESVTPMRQMPAR
jgi:hypothetical protein